MIGRWLLERNVLVHPRSHDEDDTKMKREVYMVEMFFKMYTGIG